MQRGVQGLGTDRDRATLRTLRTAMRTASALRAGLGEDSAARAVDELRSLVDSESLVITDEERVLAWSGRFAHHTAQVEAALADPPAATAVLGRDRIGCDDPACSARHLVITPLEVRGAVVGSLQVVASRAGAGLVSAVEEVADWVSGQLELADLDASRQQLVEAEVRALRAQISPHFIYNSLTAIASFVRTDPDPGARAAARLRRVHPLLVPPAR